MHVNVTQCQTASNRSNFEFLKSKSQVPEDGIELLKIIKSKTGHYPKYIRLDNSGENKKLRDIVKAKTSKIEFQFTARGTPQQNGKIERHIATIWEMVRAMMSAAGIEGGLKSKLWTECFHTAVQMKNLVVVNKGD